MKSRLNKIALLIISFALLMLAIPQQSQALDLRHLADSLLKRGICAALQMDAGECNPEVNSPNYPRQGESPKKSYPNSPQKSPTPDSPTNPYPDNLQNSPAPDSPTQPK